MTPGGPQQSVLKKIYFIKKARKGEELTTLLKNKFKSIDAIRDLLMWFEEGRDFVVTLRGCAGTGVEIAGSASQSSDGPSVNLSKLLGSEVPDHLSQGSADGQAPAKASLGKAAAAPRSGEEERNVVISPWMPTAQNYRNIIDMIATIITWMDMGRDFDITLAPQGSFDASLN